MHTLKATWKGYYLQDHDTMEKCESFFKPLNRKKYEADERLLLL